MKRKALLLVAITVVLCAVCWTIASPSAGSRDWETADLKVIKVYSVKIGEGRFQAYVVDWKGQEAVVTDTLVQTDYHVGDIIRVTMFRNKYPANKPGPDLLHFNVSPPFKPIASAGE